MNIHFIGIGGIGISGLAQLCLTRGDTISGSECQETDILKILRDKGVSVAIPQQASNIPQDCELIVYTEAVDEQNPERVEATKRNIPQRSYFQYLGEISKDYRTIAVAGTHGKTTTTGMIAAGMLKSGLAATMLVGSKLKEFGGSNFHHTTDKDEWLIVEACEYRENFKYLEPEIMLITNIERDHVDYFKSDEQYEQAFLNLGKKAKKVIFHQNDDVSMRLFENFIGEAIAFPTTYISEVQIKLAGEHNRQNAALALLLGKVLRLGDDFQNGVQEYQGAWRRQEYIGDYQGLKVYDDYGHHPTEITSTLQAFREQYPDQQIGLIFEPHQFSRTRQFFDDFLESFKGADHVGLFPIYEARDTDDDKASVSLDDFIKDQDHLSVVKTLSDAQQFTQKLNKGDILLFMGAGKISEFAHEFIDHQ